MEHPEVIKSFAEQEVRNRTNDISSPEERERRTPLGRLREQAEYFEVMDKLAKTVRGGGSWVDDVGAILKMVIPIAAATFLGGSDASKDKSTVPAMLGGAVVQVPESEYPRLVEEGKVEPVGEVPQPENDIADEVNAPPADAEAGPDAPPGSVEEEQPPTNGAGEGD